MRSVHKKITYTVRHGKRTWIGRILHPKHGDERIGYRVDLWKDGKPKTFLVARLVCMTFYGESNLTVNHKDGNRLNNNIDNLEWLSREDNIRHAFNTGLMPYPKIEIYDRRTGERVFVGSKSKGSIFMGKYCTYLCICFKKDVFENELYKWKYANCK